MLIASRTSHRIVMHQTVVEAGRLENGPPAVHNAEKVSKPGLYDALGSVQVQAQRPWSHVWKHLDVHGLQVPGLSVLENVALAHVHVMSVVPAPTKRNVLTLTAQQETNLNFSLAALLQHPANGTHQRGSRVDTDVCRIYEMSHALAAHQNRVLEASPQQQSRARNQHAPHQSLVPLACTWLWLCKPLQRPHLSSLLRLLLQHLLHLWQSTSQLLQYG